jgi:hypothetical protein
VFATGEVAAGGLATGELAADVFATGELATGELASLLSELPNGHHQLPPLRLVFLGVLAFVFIIIQ